MNNDSPFGVVDIGSSSVRLVIFERIARNPWPLFNEKIRCGIGIGMVSSGRLHKDGTIRALEALARFRTLALGMGVSDLQVVATAAVRDASNGDAFVEKANAAIGTSVRVLTGEEEAQLAAYGVLSGIPDADGLVGDLGGGSLELMEIRNGTLGRAATFPFGRLRLMDAAGGKLKSAEEIVTKAFKKTEWLRGLRGRKLYLVGGMWRRFSFLMMAQQNYPLHILQNYAVSAEDARALAANLATMDRKALEALEDLPARRVEGMPFGALVLDRLLKITGVSEVVTTAYGVREGVLYGALSEAARKADPLVEAAADLNMQLARSPGHAPELHRWIAPLFEGWPEDLHRFEQVVCFVSDIGWRYHPDYRAKRAYNRILTMPVAAMTHRARAFLALTIFVRYGGNRGASTAKVARDLLGDELTAKANAVGLALRLGYRISGAVAGLLPFTKIEKRKTTLVLSIVKGEGTLSGEIVQKRLAALADALDLEPRIEFL